VTDRWPGAPPRAQPGGSLRDTVRRADQVLAARGFVPFVEEQIERLQHGVQTAGQLASRRDFKGNARVTDSLLGARQPLGGRCFRGQKRAGNLRRG
jgi:hypothetical protein